MDQFQICLQQHWLPVLGDVPPTHWLAAAAYLVAALLSILALRAGRMGQPGRSGYVWFWSAVAILLALLGIDKVIDLQVAVLDFARCVTEVEGWYSSRVRYQELITVGTAVAGVAIVGAIVLFLQRPRPRIALAAVGMVLIGAYQLARAVSFHGLDVVIATRIQGVSVNSIIELLGIACIALNALWLLVVHRKSRHGSAAA